MKCGENKGRKVEKVKHKKQVKTKSRKQKRVQKTI
jgi:hypothetical protein